MIKDFLPSKKFTKRLVVIASIITIFFSARYIIFYFLEKARPTGPVTLVAKEVVQKDGNDNGIADWEEYLWGLDPNKDGEKNREFIMNKKKNLAISSESSGIASLGITENDQLARDFFSIIMSLSQTGEIDEETMNSISELVGQKVEDVQINDIYTQNMLVVKNDSSSSDELYYNSFKAIVDKYAEADIGSELVIISQGLANGDLQALSTAKVIAESYKSFGKDIISIPVPNRLALNNLDLANNYEKIGQSIEGLTMMLADPMVGMRALLTYKKYSEKLASNYQYMQDGLFGNLEGYSILETVNNTTQDNLQ